MKVSRRALLLSTLAVGGCSTIVQAPSSTITPRQALQWRSFVDEQLRGQIALGQIEGSDAPAVGYLRKTLAFLWGSRIDVQVINEALEDQLRALRLLAPLPGEGRFQLDAQLQTLEVEGLVMASDARAVVLYTLHERGSGGKLIYQRRMRSQGTAGWFDHGFASERQRLAKEAALKSSLVMLAQDLVTLRI